ncbi:hypothetical protein ABFP37_07050 [Burkholderia sp. RS01]
MRLTVPSVRDAAAFGTTAGIDETPTVPSIGEAPVRWSTEGSAIVPGYT